MDPTNHLPRRRIKLVAASCAGVMLTALAVNRVSEMPVGPSVIGMLTFFTLAVLSVLLLRELILAHQGYRRLRVAYMALLFGASLPLLIQWHPELGRSFIGMFLWLFPPLKYAIAVSMVAMLLLMALAFAVSRRFGTARMLLLGSAFLAVMLPLTAHGATTLIARQQRINDRRGEEIGVAIRKFHEDRGVYPTSLSELRPQYLKSIPWWWDGLIKRPFILCGDATGCELKYCSEIGTGRFLRIDPLRWHTDAL